MITMQKRKYVLLVTNLGTWCTGESIQDAVSHLLAPLRRDDSVAIAAVSADGVERLSVNQMGEVLIHGPAAKEPVPTRPQMEQIYIGPWGQRGKTHLR